VAGNVGTIVKWGAIGLGAWWVYKNYFSGVSPSTAPAPSVATSTSTPASTPVVAYNTLDAIGKRLAAAVGSVPYTADQFNYYLGQVSGVTPPDPAAVFTQAGWDRTAPMTLAQYWSATSAYLAKNAGMSGLGHLGNLASLYMRGGR
jgi:hypothetical protein